MARPVRHQIIDRPDGSFCALVLFEPDRLYRCDGFASLAAAEEWIDGLRIIMEACGAPVAPSIELSSDAYGSPRDLREPIPQAAPCRRDRMPWFYFDVIHDGDDVTRDHKGVDLTDMEAAQAHAVELWKRIIEERAAGGRDPQSWNVAILDVHGAVLALVPYPKGSSALG